MSHGIEASPEQRRVDQRALEVAEGKEIFFPRLLPVGSTEGSALQPDPGGLARVSLRVASRGRSRRGPHGCPAT